MSGRQYQSSKPFQVSKDIDTPDKDFLRQLKGKTDKHSAIVLKSIKKAKKKDYGNPFVKNTAFFKKEQAKRQQDRVEDTIEIDFSK